MYNYYFLNHFKQLKFFTVSTAAENFTMPVHTFSCQLLILILCMCCISTQFIQQKETLN